MLYHIDFHFKLTCENILIVNFLRRSNMNGVKPKRILHVVSSMHRGGAETMLMNLYRNIDRKKIQFDFVCHTMEKCDYEDEIIKLGGRIFKISSLGTS